MIACFDIGGSTIKFGAAHGPDDVRLLGRVPTPTQDFAAFVAALQDCLAVPELAGAEGISIAIAGVIDPEDGRVTCANIPCIHGRPLDRDLAAPLGRPVSIANDADCFALAEAIAGAGRGHRIVFGCILGTGVGGGLVIEGRLIVAAGGLTGEWGHGPVADRRPGTPSVEVPRFVCGCGQVGCIDTVGGARGLERLHAALHGEALGSEAIIAAWLDGDARAERTVAVQVDQVSGPLAMVVNTIGPSIVPVGGGLSRVPALIARLDEAVRARILRRQSTSLVVPGTCGAEPGLVGAGILGLQTARQAVDP